MKKLLGVVAEILVIFVVGFVCGAIWIAKDEPGWLPGWIHKTGVSHSRLAIERSPQGQFDGTMSVENHEDAHVEVYVTVNVYDGDQEVGDLDGSVTLKPHSDSNVDLTSSDRFVSFDNTTVDLLPVTGPQPD